jgi:GNAT superfamily N-acetyltransferase
VALLKIPDPSPEGMSNYEQFATGLGFVHPEHGRVYFGSGVFVNTKRAGAPDPDGYVYIYGIMEGDKSLIAARVRPRNIERFGRWTFWDGAGWSRQKEAVVPITNGVSNELSVTPSGDGRYLLTFTVMGLSEKIGIRVGESPVGPFGEIHEVYTCPEYAGRGLLPYNAKAHYHLSEPGRLLVSYNTITLNFWEDIQEDATIYHPRFVWVCY